MFFQEKKQVYLFVLLFSCLTIVSCGSLKQQANNEQVANINFNNINIQDLRLETREMMITANQLNPNTIYLPNNVKSHIRITSWDKDYEIYIPGVSSPRQIKRGQTESFIWQARTGSYPIYGPDPKNGNTKSYYGLIVVTMESN